MYLIGKTCTVDKIGDKMPPYMPIYVDYNQNIMPINSSVSKTVTTYSMYDTMTDDLVFSYNKTKNIDPHSGKFIGTKNDFFRFPSYVKKQNYNVFVYADGNSIPFTYVNETTMNDLHLYRFNCDMTKDMSYTYPQFPNTKIMEHYTCSALVEPTTGDVLSYTDESYDYTVLNSTEVPISMGTTHSTDFTKDVLTENTKNELATINSYKSIFPPIIVIALASAAIAIALIDKQKRKISELRLQKEKDDKLTIVGLLASRLAHDIRNPLSVIKNAVYLMELDHPSKQNAPRFEMIDRAVARISHQIDDVMDFVKSRPLIITDSTIKEIINKTLSLINIPTGITVVTESLDIYIRCDVTQIQVVFTNLVSNAIEALGDSGSITIRAKEEHGFVYVDVIDSGPGVPKEMVDKIFDPLFTTKQTGTGLGLVSCKNIVTNHGGDIVVSNNPSTFTVKLPKDTKPNSE